MKILIISGFLGTGKTTFIKQMAKVMDRDFAIIENEFSNIDVDTKTLEDISPEMKIYQLSEGCICCSLNIDFAHSVLTIYNSLSPDYLIVEPSGVATPSQIIKKLKAICYGDIKILSPITIIDAKNYKEQKKEFNSYFVDQLKTGRNIILSKSEDLSYSDIEKIKEDLNLKDEQNFFTTHYTNWGKKDFEKLLEEEIDLDSIKTASLKFKKLQNKKIEELDNIGFTNTKIKNVAELIQILEHTIRGRFGQIVRAKGYINLNPQGVKFDLVNKEYAITGEDTKETKLVFIGKNLNKELLREKIGAIN